MPPSPSGELGGCSLPLGVPELLPLSSQNLYESIKNEPFKIPEDDGNDLTHTFFNPDREGWLLKLGEWRWWAGLHSRPQPHRGSRRVPAVPVAKAPDQRQKY